MKNELDIVRDVSAKLLKLKIPFMLTGSMAMNYYAPPRMTRDIDLVIEMKPEDVSAFWEAFASEYYVSREAALVAVQSVRPFNLIHKESVIKVDCIVRRNSAHARVEFARRQAVQIRDFQTFIASKEDLIISKLWWARDSRSEVQLRDVRSLLATGYDERYVLDWIEKLGLSELLRESQRG
jgi:hypothetical protein